MPVSNGDLLDIKVFNTPELSGTARVNEKGEILLPVTGTVTVAGQTPDQIAVTIQKAIHDRQIMEDPRVTVLVTEYSTQMVTVTGEVKNPGVYSLVGRHDLYYVLSAAGGPTANQGSSITITRKRDPNHPETVGINSPNYSLIEQQTIIYPGDTVMVSRAGMFYVVGDVAKSGAFYIQNGEPVSILNALALAGSTNFTAASKLSLIRKTGSRVEVIPFNVKEIATAKTTDLALQNGDILFVPGSAWKRISQAAIPGLATSLAGSSVTAGLIH
jgi:polysaccharide export outer membrane protein